MFCTIIHLISSSQTTLTQYFATKLIKQKQLHLEEKYVVVQTNMQYYPHSEIIILSTLYAMFTFLSHAELLDTVPV